MTPPTMTLEETIRRLKDGPIDTVVERAALQHLKAGKREAAPKCMKCGGSHAFDTSVDSRQWNEVIRACGLPDFLCLMCIVEAFAVAGKSFKARLYGDAFHGDALSFSPQPSQQEGQ